MRQSPMRRLLGAGLATSLLSMGALLMGPVVAHSATTTTVDPLKAGATDSTNTLVVPQSPKYKLHKLNPFYSAAYCYAGDISVQQTMYRPAYYFGLGKSIAVQPLLSAANMPTYTESNGVTSVTITVKPWLWSDGNSKTYTSNGDGTTTLSSTDYHSQLASARDIVFWLNMDKAMSKGNFYKPTVAAVASNPAYAACGFVPGMGLPDQVDTVTTPFGLNGDTVVIKFTSHQNHDWLLANELSQIQPMPAAWDSAAYTAVTDPNQWATPYSGTSHLCSSETWASIKTDGSDLCSYVYGYLRSLLLTNALWHWSNGPYRIGDVGYSAGAPDGNQFIVANTHYSGPVAAKAVKKVVWLPEADTASEIAQLQAGQLTSGYVTPDMVTASPGIGKAGDNLDNQIKANYNTVGSTSWGVGYWQLNFGNVSSSTAPCVGQDGKQAHNCNWAAMLNQQYLRQAMYEAMDQKSVIKTIMNGYGIAGWSAIPGAGGGAYTTGVAKPLSYNPTKAKALLTANGWATTTTSKKVNGVDTTVLQVNPTGGADTATCRWSVGSQAHPYGCGTQTWPIDNGTSLSFDFIYPSGSPTTDAEVNAYASYLQLVGIHLNVTAQDATTVGNTCFSGAADWQICWYGGWIYAPDYYPSGETLFGTGAGSNNFGYSNPIMDGLIAATTQSGSSALNASISMADLGLTSQQAAAAGNPGNAATSFVAWSAKDLPVLWVPWGTGFGERLNTIRGAQPPNPLGDFNPEYITFIK